MKAESFSPRRLLQSMTLGTAVSVAVALLATTASVAPADAFAATAKTQQAAKKKAVAPASSAKKKSAKASSDKSAKVAAADAPRAKASRKRVTFASNVHGGHHGAVRKVAFQPRRPTVGQAFGLHDTPDALALRSSVAYVVDQNSGEPLFDKNSHAVVPIASISKLMTAVVARDADRPLNGVLRVTAHDRDTIKFTGSRLQVGSELSRREMFHIALMSSENRAAAALSRDYPGGRAAFVKAMNREARRLGMRHTHFREPTGLSPHNVSTAEDLAKLVGAAAQDPLIRYFSTDTSTTVRPGDGELLYVNSDPLVRYRRLPIRLQKTGFINESGHGVVMRMRVKGRRETVVLLGAPTRAGVSSDAIKIHRWLSCSIQ